MRKLRIQLNNGDSYEFDRTWDRSYCEHFVMVFADGVTHQFPYASIAVITTEA